MQSKVNQDKVLKSNLDKVVNGEFRDKAFEGSHIKTFKVREFIDKGFQNKD